MIYALAVHSSAYQRRVALGVSAHRVDFALEDRAGVVRSPRHHRHHEPRVAEHGGQVQQRHSAHVVPFRAGQRDDVLDVRLPLLARHQLAVVDQVVLEVGLIARDGLLGRVARLHFDVHPLLDALEPVEQAHFVRGVAAAARDHVRRAVAGGAGLRVRRRLVLENARVGDDVAVAGDLQRREPDLVRGAVAAQHAALHDGRRDRE